MGEEKKRPELKNAFNEVLKVLRENPDPSTFENMDVEEVIKNLEGALETLDKEMGEIYNETGMTKEQLEEYANNPDNFSKEEWKLLSQVREELHNFEDEATAILGPTPLEGEAAAHEVVAREAKKRTGKGKKGWKRA